MLNVSPISAVVTLKNLLRTPQIATVHERYGIIILTILKASFLFADEAIGNILYTFTDLIMVFQRIINTSGNCCQFTTKSLRIAIMWKN